LVCIIITSVLLLHTLNSLWYQLSELNEHQLTYKQMWVEERTEMAQQLKHDEETRNAMFNMFMRQMRDASKAQQRQQVQSHRQRVDGQQQQQYPAPPQRSPLISGSIERRLKAAIRNSNVLDDLSD
jgi:methionine synthase II (cobalamin-independent)